MSSTTKARPSGLCHVCAALLALLIPASLFAQDDVAADDRAVSDAPSLSAEADDESDLTADEAASEEAASDESTTRETDDADAAKPTAKQEVAKKTPLGRVVRLESPIDDSAIKAVRTAAVDLSARAENEGREAVLVLELQPGTSEFHNINGLTTALVSADYAKLKTVCWVPESVDGYNAMVALACREVVMHPDASLGDFGRGEPLENDEIEFARRLVDGRGNTRVNEAVATAFADPGVTLLAIDVQP